jgi:hypothetical protein
MTDILMMIHNSEELWGQLGATTVRHSTDPVVHRLMEAERDFVLARGRFLDEVPTATHVEFYRRSDDLKAPGGPAPYLFLNDWKAPLTRTQALFRQAHRAV